jgi:hypothetical protein
VDNCYPSLRGGVWLVVDLSERSSQERESVGDVDQALIALDHVGASIAKHQAYSYEPAVATVRVACLHVDERLVLPIRVGSYPIQRWIAQRDVVQCPMLFGDTPVVWAAGQAREQVTDRSSEALVGFLAVVPVVPVASAIFSGQSIDELIDRKC